MGCEYIYNGQKYTIDELGALLENGLADDLLKKNIISDTGVFSSGKEVAPQEIVLDTSGNSDVDTKGTTRFIKTVTSQARSVVKALKKLTPNLRLTIHTSPESWNALKNQLLTQGYTEEDLVNMDKMQGFYVEGTSVIHLNGALMEKNNAKSVLFHEASHAVINALFNSKSSLRNQMEGQIRQLSLDPSVPQEYRDKIKEVIDFGASYEKFLDENGERIYDENFVKNETIVEFIAKVCSGEIQITPKEKTAWETFVSILNNLGLMVGFNVRLNSQDVTVNNVLEFANTLNNAFKAGREISFEDAVSQLVESGQLEIESNNPQTISEGLDSMVKYNGEEGVLYADEENNVIFDNGKKEVLLGKTTNPDFANSSLKENAIEFIGPAKKGVFVEGNVATVDGKKQTIVSLNRDSDGNIISYTYKNEQGKKRTSKNIDIAEQINKAMLANEITSNELSEEKKQKAEEVVTQEFKKEYGGEAERVIDEMPEEVLDTFINMMANIKNIAQEELQAMAFRANEWIDFARQRIERSNAPDSEKAKVNKILDSFNKDLNKYYSALEKERLNKEAANEKRKAKTIQQINNYYKKLGNELNKIYEKYGQKGTVETPIIAAAESQNVGEGEELTEETKQAVAAELSAPIIEGNDVMIPVEADIKPSNVGTEDQAVKEKDFKDRLVPNISGESDVIATTIGTSGLTKITDFENKKFDKLVADKKIQFNVPYTGMNGKVGIVSHPDSMMVGQLKGYILDKNGKPVLDKDGNAEVKVIGKGSGGVFFATKDIWAFKKQSGGQSFVNRVNNMLLALKAQGKEPVVYFFLGKGGAGKMLSNKEAPAAVVKIYENLHRANIISDDVLKKSIESALKLSEAKMDAEIKKKEKKIEEINPNSEKNIAKIKEKTEELQAYKENVKRRKENNVKQIEKLIGSKGASIENILEDVFAEDGSFEDRGQAIKDLLEKSFTYSKAEKSQAKLIEYFGIKNVTKQGDFMDEVSKALFEEPVLLNVPKQYVYAAIKIDSPIKEFGKTIKLETGEIIETHATYESHVRFEDENKTPELLFFDVPFKSVGSFKDLQDGSELSPALLGYSQIPLSSDAVADIKESQLLKITPSLAQEVRPNDLVSASESYSEMNEDGMGNYVLYPSIVTNQMADVNKDGVVDFTNERKEGQENIVKVPYEAAYPMDTNPLGVEGETKKEIADNAFKLGFPVVVAKNEEGTTEVYSSNVIPVEPIKEQTFTQNKNVIVPSFLRSKAEIIVPGRIGSEAVVDVKYNGGPVRELSKFQKTSIGKSIVNMLTPLGGATVEQKEMMENIAGEQGFVVATINKNVSILGRQINSFAKGEGKKLGIKKETVQAIVNNALNGPEIDPKTGKKYIDQLPSDIADTVVVLRQSRTNLQDVLANSGLLPADMAMTIVMSQGSYMKDSYAAFEVKPYGWFKKMVYGKKNPHFNNISEETRNKVRHFFKTQLLLGKLDNGFNVNIVNYKTNFEDPYYELLKQDPTAALAATQQAGLKKDQAYKELQKKADEFAQAKINEIEDYNPNGDIMFSLSGSPIKMTDYIEKNPNLAPALKEYLGHITDPALSFKLTAVKLNRMLYSHKTIQAMKNLGLTSGDVLPATEATPKGWIKLGQISTKDSKEMKGSAVDEVDSVNKYGPLKGCSVSPEFYNLVFETPVEGNWYYKFITSRVKLNAAVLNVKNIIRNVWGYAYFGGANGVITEAAAYAVPLLSTNMRIKSAQDLKTWFVGVFQEAQKRGINNSIEYSEIEKMAEQLGNNKEILKAVANSKNPSFELLTQVGSLVSNTTSEVVNAFGKVIYYGDAIPKTLMFELFRNTTAYDMARTNFAGLSEKQKEAANKYAERRVKMTTVTDSRTIKGADIIQRKTGIFGTFPRFTAEVVRTFINNHYILVKPEVLREGVTFSENKEEDKAIKNRLDRKARFTTMAGLAFYYGAFDLIRALMALGDDDEDLEKVDIPSNGILELLQMIYKDEGTMTQSEAIRKMLPSYDRFADLQFKINDDGTVTYRNQSTSDPFGIWGQAYRSIIYSDGPGSSTVNLLKNVGTPALGLEITFGTALEIFNGTNSKGDPIYAPDDLASKQMEDIISYFARKTGPNIYTSGMRYKDLVNMGKRGQEEGAIATAMDYASYTFGEGVLGRESVIDVKKKLKSKVSEVKDDWNKSVRKYSGEFYLNIDPEERKAVNENRDEAARRNAYKLHDLIMASYALNLSEEEVKQVLKDARISKKVRKAVLRGGEYLDKLDVNDIEEK